MPNPFTNALNKLHSIPDGAFVFAARIAMAAFFIRAGQTKLNGFELSSSAIYLFKEEYKVPILSPEVAAWAAISAEHLFPVLLIIGFATRLSAIALLGMAGVIQIFVYPASWPDHLMWAVMLGFIAARGPGPLSLDGVFLHKVA